MLYNQRYGVHGCLAFAGKYTW